MRKRELNLFRRLLDGRRQEIIDDAERALGSMNQKMQDSIADPADRATLESDRNLLLRIREREGKLLAKINAAFARIDRGVYGVCEECGDKIGLARLKARPVTTLCIACKSAQEEREREGWVR
jgi:DnaK suppressor protein